MSRREFHLLLPESWHLFALENLREIRVTQLVSVPMLDHSLHAPATLDNEGGGWRTCRSTPVASMQAIRMTPPDDPSRAIASANAANVGHGGQERALVARCHHTAPSPPTHEAHREWIGDVTHWFS
jgi:hypothetical protein